MIIICYCIVQLSAVIVALIVIDSRGVFFVLSYVLVIKRGMAFADWENYLNFIMQLIS